MKIGKRKKLKAAREGKRFTQAEVAKYLGVTTNAYQAIELGNNGTSESNWLKLYDLFDKKIPLNELMENKDLFPLPIETSPDEALTRES